MSPTDAPDPAVNPGYALGRLAAALRTRDSHPDAATRDRAARKADTWVRVFEGVLSGALGVGSRTPVAGVPAWATLEVVKGGFATGTLLAEGPLLPHERDRLAALPAAARGAERGALNASYLTDAGLAELGRLLDSGSYRVTVPEEGALLAVAWLLRQGDAAAARAVLDAVGPFFRRLRFYPVPAATPFDPGPVVHVQTVGDTVRQVAAVRVPRRVLAQREAIRVWAPLFDRMVALFRETVEGPPPTLRRGDGRPARTPSGGFVIDGGWPCQHYPADWGERAAAVLADYRRLRAEHPLCAKFDRPKRRFGRLRGLLEACAADPRQLTGRDVGFVRLVLAAAAGRGDDYRRRQEAQAAAPATAEFAALVLARLAAVPADGGLDAADAVAGAVSPEEAARHGLPAGRALPDSLLRKVWRCAAAEASVLVAAGVIPSAEALARVVPQVAAHARAAAIADPALRRLDQAVYAAFRRRRSLLLLNLASQVKLAELPWVAACEPHRPEARGPARRALADVVTLAVTAFPQQIVPNKLLQEVRALADAAGLADPLVDEVAADIFMGTFTEKYLRAAQAAGRLLGGGLYERYYGLPFARVLATDDVAPSRYGAPTSAAFAALCVELAGAGEGGRGSVARNGTVIEQEQLLTTHNLAVLFDALGLTETLRPRLRALAEAVFNWTCRTVARERGHWHARLRAVKNAAYGWRQMVFFLALLPADEVDRFLAWAGEQRPGRLAPALEGLRRAARGEPAEAAVGSARRFLGWTTGRHWLLTPADPGA